MPEGCRGVNVGTNHRLGLASSVAGLAGSVSYFAQRVLALGGAVDPGAVMAAEHIPFNWRMGLALLHALVAALVVYTLVDDQRASRWLAHMPWVVLAVTTAAGLVAWLAP
jgi:hypothetical protein